MEDKYLPQLRKVRNAFYDEPKSRFMVAIETGVPIQNVCRLVDMLRDDNNIAIAKKGCCEISHELVEFLTTNPEDFPEDNQLTLF